MGRLERSFRFTTHVYRIVYGGIQLNVVSSFTQRVQYPMLPELLRFFGEELFHTMFLVDRIPLKI